MSQFHNQELPRRTKIATTTLFLIACILSHTTSIHTLILHHRSTKLSSNTLHNTMQPWIFKYQPSNSRRDPKRKQSHNPFSADPRRASIITAAILLFFIFFFRTLFHHRSLCPTATPLTKDEAIIAAEFNSTPIALIAILHYATANQVPQLTPNEIGRPIEVLQSIQPCNLLIFGIGHDALMWDTFNPRGTTVFLEEDPSWTMSYLARFPVLRAHTVRYTTRLSEAKALLASYKKDCARNDILKDYRRCPLALSELPDEVYESDWDMVVIDAPRGYMGSQPGRMSVIYSVAVMARGRKRPGVTHVFLHDVDRGVEQQYAKEFLCFKYRVSGTKKFWHFVIPPATDDSTSGFC